MFAAIYELTRLPQSTFFVLFVVTAVSYGWLHWTVVNMLQQASPALENQLDFKDAAEQSK